MNKKRMSDRKSQLRLTIQDFCLSLPENSDPIVGYLLTILQWQASLDVETNSILHRSFVNQIQQLKCRLKLQMKTLKNKCELVDCHSNNISKLINQFHKLKEVFAYCLILSKKHCQLYKQVQKFFQYQPKEPNLTQELQNYLNQPIIFQTIFRSYLRVYNINIMTADLINFLYTQHQQKYKANVKQKVMRKKWVNSDIQHLKCQNIIFKQLKDMNKKYIDLENKLKNSCIYFICDECNDVNESTSGLSKESTNINININQNCEQKQQNKRQQQKNLKQKIKRLQKLLQKIKNQPGLYSSQKSTNFIIQPEPIYNFSIIQISNDYQSWKVLQFNKQFFLQTLYGGMWTQSIIGDQQFTFLREKILKIQALLQLNRILSAINVISYTYNQLDLQVRQNYEYEFINLRKLIGSQFINKQIYSSKKGRNKDQKNIFVSNDKNLKSMTVIDGQNNKILYPSAINYFLNIIKNLLSIQFSQKQQILQILQVQCQHIQILAQTILNIFHIIKIKHLSSYKLLRQYIQIILKSCCWNNMGQYYSHFQSIVEFISMEKQKIGIISQIIYQFDHNYSIKEALQELVRIQFDGLTKNCSNTLQLYKQILFQIIQIRNNLKLDHYYSINQIHQTFSLIPPDFQKIQQQKMNTSGSGLNNVNMSVNNNMNNSRSAHTNGPNRRQDLYFQDIIHQVCIASHHNLYLPKLFIFFDLQLKFKRILFKLQLCWSSANKQSIFDKKSQAFKDFLATYSSPILQIVNQSHQIVDILSKMQQVQRYINIFDNQVSRFYLVQKLVSIITSYKDKYQIHSLRQHLNRLSLQNLQQLNSILSIFNPIQCHKQSTRLKIIQKLQKNIRNNSSIRIGELKNYNPTFQKQKQKLSSIILILHIINNKQQQKDHQNIIKLYKEQPVSYNLYQLKNNQLVSKKYQQLIPCQNLQQLIRYYQDLLVLSIFTTLRQIQSQNQSQSNLFYGTNLSKILTNTNGHTQTNSHINCSSIGKCTQGSIPNLQGETVANILQDRKENDKKNTGYSHEYSYKELQKLMNMFQLSSIFTSLTSIQEIQFWRNQLGIMTKYHQIYQLMFHFDCFNSKIYGNSCKKAHYKDSKYLNYVNHTVNFSYQTSHFITILNYLFHISPLTKMKLQKNLQLLQQQILQTESVHRRPSYYHNKLKKKIYLNFCSSIQKMINKHGINDEIQIKFDGKKQPKEYIDLLRKKMLKDVSSQYKYEIKQDGYGQFRQIQMFKEKKGYQLPIIQAKENKQYKIVTKKNIERAKKPIISPQRINEQKKRPLEELRRKFKIQMLKSSMQIRKHISKLQLSQNKIRQQIIWETSKLEHSVIEKINQFITLSNVDKQQSYIKFKHTVNLQTIKGIQNVIQEQTQMYMQKKNALTERQDTFLTNIQCDEQEKIDKNRLLDANVQSILQHMKKIKIFSGWKKTMKKTDLTKKQWCNFNANVQKILNNDKIAQSLSSIDETRNNYLKQNVTCEIMKEQNMRISEKIQDLKLNNLEKKVLNYREKLLS